MHRKNYAALIAGIAALALVLAATTGFVTSNDGTAPVAGALLAPMEEPDGAEEWMYLQRANADGSIPDAAVNEAVAQSKAAGQASKGSPATDQVWTELGPSNIGGRIRDIAFACKPSIGKGPPAASRCAMAGSGEMRSCEPVVHSVPPQAPMLIRPVGS